MNKELKKYNIKCLQGTNFMEDTFDEPLTEKEIRERFWFFDECRTETFKQFTLDYIAETWMVEIKEVR